MHQKVLLLQNKQTSKLTFWSKLLRRYQLPAAAFPKTQIVLRHASLIVGLLWLFKGMWERVKGEEATEEDKERTEGGERRSAAAGIDF